MSDYPVYQMSSVNGNYMDTGSRYAPNINPIQESQSSYTSNYYEIEDRNSNNYPPIGQLVPVGGDCFIFFILLYAIIRGNKQYKRSHDR